MSNPVTTESAAIERALLGALILDATRVLEHMDARKVGSELFTAPHHAKVFAEIRELAAEGIPVDGGSLSQRLRDHQRFDEIGGLAAIEAMIDACPTATHAEYFLNDLHDRLTRRTMLRLLEKARGEVTNPDESAEIVRGKIEADFAALQTAQQARQRTPSEHLADMAQAYERAIQGGCAGIKSGYWFWDEYFGGLQDKVYYIVSGPPGCFKTTLVRNVAEYVAGVLGYRVDFASLEQSAGQILSSMTARMAGVWVSSLNAGKSEANLYRWKVHAKDVGKWPIFVNDEAQTDVTLWSWARRAKSKGSRLLIVDYLQFVQVDGKCNEEQRMARVSDAARRIAKDLDIPLIAISSETKGDAKTGAGPSLRHSAQIEYDAWCWVRMRKNEDAEGKVLGAWASIRKNRFGPQVPEWPMSHRLGYMEDFRPPQETTGGQTDDHYT
jgi:replicative DNA helicase